MTSNPPIDLLTLFARFGREQRTSLRDPNAAEAFTGVVKKSLTAALDDDTLLHGQRTQNMFEALIISLGHYKLLKTEDTGTVYPKGQYTAPDFRVILKDDSQWLIEVKNVYDRDPAHQRFNKMTETGLAKLTAYAEVMNCPLKFALYWARWGIWTLVDASELVSSGRKRTIDMFKAVRVNELAQLGDLTIGTGLPLKLRFVVDQTKPRTIDSSGEVALTFSGATMFCGANEISDSIERNIAWIFMQYGDWTCSKPNAIISGNKVDAIELVWEPEVRANELEGFELIGTLSSVFSRYYASHTLGDGGVIQTEAELVPNWFAPLIASDHKSIALPLWKFVLQPSRGTSTT